jgi:hypothetical protein
MIAVEAGGGVLVTTGAAIAACGGRATGTFDRGAVIAWLRGMGAAPTTWAEATALGGTTTAPRPIDREEAKSLCETAVTAPGMF